MKILLFGASGCFGTEFLSVAKNFKIKVFSYPSKKLDLVNFKQVQKKIKTLKPNVIINSTAIIGINKCEIEYNKSFEINSVCALNLAKICKKENIILVQTSSHAVFDGKKKSFYNENDKARPNNIYSGTKYLGELFVENICKKYYIIRFPTLFGNRNNNLLGFVDKTLLSLKKDKPLKIADDKIDSPTYARDAAELLIKMIIKKKPYGIYHLANSGKVSYYKFVLYLKKILKSKSKIIPVKDNFFPSKGFKSLKTSMNSVKLKPLRSWKNSLKEYLRNQV